MAEGFKGHRGFAAFCNWQSKHETGAQAGLRRDAGNRVHGRVLEIGVGVGGNWDHLPAGIDYTGIEPDLYLLERARGKASEREEQRMLTSDRAEKLPFDDASFDTVLSTWTLCTIADPRAALAEFARVLKPGGSLVFAEHVRPRGRIQGRVMDAVTPVWRRLFGGCHPNRRTESAITQAGLEITECDRSRVDGLPMISGVARKPGA
jgi:ubiquinone/menaquinone biosynthesis C-methylase UbiE